VGLRLRGLRIRPNISLPTPLAASAFISGASLTLAVSIKLDGQSNLPCDGIEVLIVIGTERCKGLSVVTNVEI
jgi:hypothetical protein